MKINFKIKSASILFLIFFCFLTYSISFAAVSSPQPNDPTAQTSGGNWFLNMFKGFGGGSSGGGGASGSWAPNTTSNTGSKLSGKTVSPTNNNTKATSVSSCDMSNIKDFKDLVSRIVNCLLTPFVVLLLSCSIIIFIIGIFKFIGTESSVEDKTSGRLFIFWGIVGIFVIISLWGLVNVLQNEFNLSSGDITPRQVNIGL